MAYGGLVVFGASRGRIAGVGEALVIVLAVAAYGFVLNDLTDIEADRLSGQPNRMAGLPPAWRLAALGAPLAIAVGMAAWAGDRVLAALTALNLALPSLYSVPPVRLKGRGVLGALADAAGVHAVPMALVTWAVTRHPETHADQAGPFLASAIAWTLCLGLRGIVVHQAQGLAGDRAAQVHTFAAAIGKEGARRLVWRGIVPAEVLALSIFLVIVLPMAPVLLVTLLLFALVEARQLQLGWTMPLFDPPGRSSEPYRPLVSNAWYELWMPLGLALQLAWHHPWAWGVVGAHLLLFRGNLAARTRALLPILQAPLFPPATRGSGFETYLPRGAVDARALKGVRVFVTAPVWTANGLNYWTGDLVRGLRRAGVDATVVLTEESTPLVTIAEPRMTRPSDIPVVELPVEQADNWGARWAALGRLVEQAAPAVLILTNDWRSSAIVPLLSARVRVVGVVHGVDALYDEQVQRLATSWDLLVGGTPEVSAHLHAIAPELDGRIVTIPHGVSLASEQAGKEPLRDRMPRLLVIGDPQPGAAVALQRMVADAEHRGLPWRLTVVDPADEMASLCQMRAVSVTRMPNRQEWSRLYHTHHAVIALDWNDDRRRHLVEAMGHGIVPVTWDIAPPDAPFRPGHSGLGLGGGGPLERSALAALLDDATRVQEMSARAREAVVGRHYSADQMVDAFVDRIAWALGQPRRPRDGRLAPPPAEVAGERIWGMELSATTAWGSFPDTWSAETFARIWTQRDESRAS